MKIFEKRLVSFLLALALIVGLLPPVSLKAKAETTGLEGKTISILGDSISTYQNYSNGTAAGTTNSTITNGAIYYPRSGFDVTVDSTWWYQAAQELGLDVLVNNSWSGSCLLNTRSGTVGAYVDRCVQLHDDTGDNAGQEPDIIAIFLGTNDYYTYPSTLGSYESIAFDTLITKTEAGYAYAEPATSMEAYAIILHKIAQRYPEAQVYCFTLLPRVNSTSQPTALNEDIKQLANHFGAITVDLHNCGIQPDSTHMGDNLHPNSAGMDAMTNAFVSAVLKNSGGMTYHVSFNLDGVVAMEGTTRTVISGDEFRATLKGKTGNRQLNVSVKMGGADITAQCYADGVVQIPAVNGDVVITASLADRDPLNFRWEYDAQKDALVSGSANGNTENALTMTSGSITDGKFSKVKYTLDEAVILKHDKPWVIEWKSSGTWSDTTDGALLFAGDATSSTADKPYLYRRHNSDFIAFGVSTGGQYHNYGVALSANGIDGTVDHTYKLENRISADGSNMVYLYVDDQEIGPMNHHWVGGTDKKETVDWLNGQDLVFTHMGTSPHTIGNCRIDYVQVWEDGEVPAEPQWNPQNFRWEYDAQKNALVSGSSDGNTENALTMTSGSITDGKFSKVKYTLDEAVILKHDKPWVIEWKSSGTWSDTTDGALLFAGAETSTTADTPYLYRRHNSDFIAFGVSTGGQYHNYGVKLGANGIDGTIDHTYKLENRISADGSNMVYLYVDDQEIGPMNHHWVGGTDKKETVDWLNGQDLVFTHMGTNPHTIGNCYIDYIQVWENGVEHVHKYTAVVTAPTCTEQGYTTYTCQCGDSYADDYVDADGHDFTDWYMTREATYEQAGEESRDCKKCSHVEFRAVEVAVVTSGNVGYGTPYTNAVTYTLYADGTMVIAGSGTVYCSDWRGNNQPYYAYRDQVKNLIIEEGITQTSGGCFAYFVNLERVSFPDSLIKINKNAFMNSFVSSMTSITIPATVTYLADYAFGFYSGAASATFTDVIIENPNASFHASNAVFNSGKKLQNLTLYSYGTENNVRTYAETHGCRYIDLNNYLEGDFGDVHYELSNGVLVLEALVENAEIAAENQPWASMVDKITKIVISDGVTTIADNAFADYTALTEVELPHGLEVIGDGVFTVSQSNDTSLTMALPRRLTAVGEGLFAGRSNVSLTVYYGSLGAEIAESGVTLDIQKVFKILLIGNSFSEDASNAGMPNSQMLDILQAMLGEDAMITVGLCYSGGKGLNWHATQSEQGNSSYSLRVISTESGAWKNYGSYTSAKALTWTDWDVVSLQHYEINTTTGKESNAYSDQVDPKFDNLESATEFMLDYVDAYAPDATVYFYMHWSRAYKANLNESLAEYNKMAAFFPVVMDYAGPESNQTFEGIIPVGLAVQNARTTYLAMLSYNSEKGITVNMQNDPQIGLQRDGGHMTYNVGRYIAALTFAETIIPEDMRAESYVLPEIRVTESMGKLPKEYSIIAQKSVLAAVNSWKNGSLAVTNIEGYTEDPTVVASETLKKLPLELKCADAEALAEQIREAVRAALDADFAVDTVTVDTAAQTASVTIRFGYTSVVVEMGYTLSAHSYENGACTGCGQKEPVVLHSYRWEIENNAMVSVTTDGNTVNDLTLTSGSITGGALKNIRYSLSKAVNLYHDVPWVIEWRSSGNWDGMLLASNADTSVNGTTYLFRFASMNFLALGDHTNTWNNYGLIHEIDMSVPHLFRLENRIGADGTNTVYLLVDGVEIDAMHHYYNSGTNQNKIVNWANGRDIVFGNIGTSSHPVNNLQLEYLQIWENGHDHDYRSAVTAPTCTEEGYTTYTCDCGSSYVGDYVDAKGHSYENGSCKVCGAMASNPYAGKTIACIGDSITAAYGVTKDKTDYVKLLADRLEMNYIRLGASGTSLCANGGRVCNIDKLTESKLQGADVVTIAMGINDFCGAGVGYYELGDINSTDSSTIYGAVRMWCEQIVELRKTDSLKDTEFYFVTPLITSWNNSVTSARNWDQSKVNIHGYTLRDLCNAIIEVAALYDVAVIDMNLISGLYYVSAEDNNIDVFGGDGVHPGDEGHAMMAAALEDMLLERYLLDDHDHSYGSWITTTYPDCEGGEEKRVCGICRATESRALAGKGHSYENGYCTDCGAQHPELADYAGKVISIMGDSISTFAGYIPVADGFNREHLARYPQDNLLTDVNETWWMQVVAELDAKLGINDSWRGATLSGGPAVTTGDTGENAAMSNLTRIQNLGSNGTPDVILLYGGTNDLAHVSKVGSFDPATAPTEVDLVTKKWDNLADGFVHTILRMRHYYPDAVIVAMLPTYTASYYSDEKLAQGNAVMAAICEHYGIAYVDLRDSGVTAEHLPDGIHPGEEGMDLITEAVVDALLSQCDVQAGENVVYPVSHELEGVKASLGHWKGVSAGKAFVETLTGDDLSVTVTMDGADITEEVYENGVISIEEVNGALVITAKGVFTADGHLQKLPEKAYNTTNLWDVLEHDEMYYAANGWAVHSSGNVKSVTVPVVAGDRIWATSFGAAGENGANMNGIRVTYFTKEGLLKSMGADEVYKEFSKNGYLTVPEGAVAVCVPMWAEDGAEMYILTLPAIPSDKNVHLSQKAKLQPDGSFTFTLEIYASEKVALYEDAVIRYVLSQGFVMTEKSEVEAVRVSELLSDAVLYEVTVEATELTVTVDGGVLDVTGYDLNKSYIAQDHAGDKLVITISHVEATDDVIWGENMDISTADSGIWSDEVMAVAFAKGSAFFRKNVHVMDYAQQITLDEENVIHLDADGMGCFGEASIRLEMACGTAVVEEDGIVYTPGTMQWNGYDRFYAFAKENETYSWTKVAVIPANNVYYEDSFVATSAEDAAAGAGIYYTNGTKPQDVAQDVWDSWNGRWESVSDNKTGNSVENSSDVQGWIEDLAGQTGFTGGSAHLVQAMVGQRVDSFPKATFTFTGTGVDIYSFINNTTGVILVQVSDVKGTYPPKYYLMDISANTAEGYYQVPTISFVGMGYSTYQVTIMVTTGAASKNRFAYYLDGIRVYNPLGEDAKDETVEDAYGDENHAVFGSVRQMLLDAGSFTGETGEGTGFVFLDQLPDSENSGSTNMIGTYETYGPKNEVYLAKGQAIAFKVDETLYSRVQVGLKSLTGEEVQAVVSYFDEKSAAAAQGMVSIPHTADLYYELMPMEGYVVIRNTSDAILAVTKVKLMVSGDPQQISAQVEKVSQAEVLEAVDEFDALPMMTYRLRNFRPDVEIAQPEASPEELAMAQMRVLLEKLFGSIRNWLKKA